MKKRIALFAAPLVAALALASPAFAWTNAQITQDACQVEQCYPGPVTLTARSGTASSGTFSATMCSSQVVNNGSEYYYSYPMVWYLTGTYSNKNGGLWETINATTHGYRC